MKRSPTGRTQAPPAMQNIPIRTEFGKRVRDAFLRPTQLAAIDYAELELRAVATGLCACPACKSSGDA